jgi:hypothetical protein
MRRGIFQAIADPALGVIACIAIKAMIARLVGLPRRVKMLGNGHGLRGRRPEILRDGQPGWGRALGCSEIYFDHAENQFQVFNAFADKDENLELPGSDWDLNFSEQDGKTKVSISIYNESLERLERMIEGGMREGTIMQLNNPGRIVGKINARVRS